jgi:hypothetical protein
VHQTTAADAPRGAPRRIGGGLHGPDVAANHHRHVARADEFLADERDVVFFTIASAASTDPMKPRFSRVRELRYSLLRTATLTDCWRCDN